VNYRQCGKTRQKYLSSCLVAWDIIISRLSDAISISGYIPTHRNMWRSSQKYIKYIRE